MGLTAKQETFKNRIIAGDKPIDAARAAKYKGNDVTLSAVAYENLRKPRIKEAIDEYRAELNAKVENKLEDVLRGVMAIAYPGKDKDGQPIIVNTGDRLRAMELLGKNCKAWASDGASADPVKIVIEQPKDYPKLNKGTG